MNKIAFKFFKLGFPHLRKKDFQSALPYVITARVGNFFSAKDQIVNFEALAGHVISGATDQLCRMLQKPTTDNM